MDSDSDHEVKQVVLPKYRIHHNDIPIKLFHEILQIADEEFGKHSLDKDTAISICSICNFRAQFEGGEGEWQCIIGKNFAASLQFDNKFLTFFDLIDRNKSVLLFKSG